MKINIKKARILHLDDCKNALLKSTLGQEYFSSEEYAISSLTEGIRKGELFVAVDDEGACFGFLWFLEKGAFHSFPYLHLIAVKEEFRGLGIGKKMLDFFEASVFKDSAKVFLVVADFNPDAKRLYERVGYKQVAEIPNLYKDGVTEFLMMKERDTAIS